MSPKHRHTAALLVGATYKQFGNLVGATYKQFGNSPPESKNAKKEVVGAGRERPDA